MAEVAREQSDAAAARAFYENARELYHRLEDLIGEAGSLFGMAELAREESDTTAARRFYGRARELYQRAGDSAGLARCETNLIGAMKPIIKK